MKDNSSRSTRENFEAGKNAREWGARNYYNHCKKQGKDPSFSECERYVKERADLVDKKRERGE